MQVAAVLRHARGTLLLPTIVCRPEAPTGGGYLCQRLCASCRYFARGVFGFVEYGAEWASSFPQPQRLYN